MGIVDLFDLGGIFDDKTVRLEEIGKNVISRPVPADPPANLEALLFHAAGTAHQRPIQIAVDQKLLLAVTGDLIEVRQVIGSGQQRLADVPAAVRCSA